MFGDCESLLALGDIYVTCLGAGCRELAFLWCRISVCLFTTARDRDICLICVQKVMVKAVYLRMQNVLNFYCCI